MPRLTLELLGPARITADAQPLDLRVRKELALLAFLAVEQRCHRRETILGLLWPDTPEETARNNLRVVLAALRGDYASQCTYARRQLALEPWREATHAQLMRGLWASGQRAAALEQYELCRRILADELGLHLSPDLTAFAERQRGAA